MAESPSMTFSSKGSALSNVITSSTLYGRRKLKEDAEAELFKTPTETAALEYLCLSKPAYLVQDGSDVWVDQKDVNAKMSEIILKLKVHSYPERAARLQYLQRVLAQKWANKPDTYKSMLTFLTEMYDRPTRSLHLWLNTVEYSTSVEEDVDNAELVLHGEELRQAELRKEEFRQEVVNELLGIRINVSYSSEDELSDWELSSSSDENHDEVFNKSVTGSVKESPVELVEVRPSEAEIKERATKFWENQAELGHSNFRLHLRHVEGSALTEQPVISSLMALYTRFGEHWEWKKSSSLNQRPQIMFLSEYDIIQELLWQFVSPSNENSPIFTADWNLRQEITVRTLSHSALNSFLAPFASSFSKLQKMKQFIRTCDVADADSYPTIFYTYSHTLSQVLIYIVQELNQIERDFKNQNSNTCRRRPTTLIQLHALLHPTMKLIMSLEHLHTQAISLSESTPNWLKALQLISCLETYLSLATDPKLYGLVLYIFSKCLMTFLDIILRPLEMKDWNSSEFLFKRSTTIKITEAKFWDEIITIQGIEAELDQWNIRPLSFLNWILQKVLTVLKVQEIIDQLGTEIGLSSYELMNRPLPSYKSIATEFLDELLQRNQKIGTGHSETHNIYNSNGQNNLEDHLLYLGLKDSAVSCAFETVLKNEELVEQSKITKLTGLDYMCNEIKSFATIESIPLLQTAHALRITLEKNLEPYFRCCQESLRELFQRYDITNTIQLVQDIIFGAKEEFALACIRLGYETRYFEQTGQLEECENPNSKFQAILNLVYPEDRNSFEIQFIFEPNSSTASFGLKIIPQFPLTLLLTPKTVSRYEYVAREIFRIRKGLWILNRLNIKHCNAATDVERKRVLLLRFAMIHFWSSLRSFVLISIFNPNEATGFSFDETSDINEILKVYEDASGVWPLYRILSLKLMDSMIIKPMLHSTMILSKKWKTGIPVLDVTGLGLRVKRSWELILELGCSSYSSEVNQIAQFFGPIPENIF